jgi:hypothetical protein
MPEGTAPMSNGKRTTVSRDEWNHVLDTAPATPSQRGAVMRECDRLGLTDRGARLAVCADLLDVDEVRSTGDLTMGQAGQLLRYLSACPDRSELPAPRRPRLSPVAALALVFAASRGRGAPPGAGNGQVNDHDRRKET